MQEYPQGHDDRMDLVPTAKGDGWTGVYPYIENSNGEYPRILIKERGDGTYYGTSFPGGSYRYGYASGDRHVGWYNGATVTQVARKVVLALRRELGTPGNGAV